MKSFLLLIWIFVLVVGCDRPPSLDIVAHDFQKIFAEQNQGLVYEIDSITIDDGTPYSVYMQVEFELAASDLGNIKSDWIVSNALASCQKYSGGEINLRYKLDGEAWKLAGFTIDKKAKCKD